MIGRHSPDSFGVRKNVEVKPGVVAAGKGNNCVLVSQGTDL